MALQKKHFVGQDRKLLWHIDDVGPGQFITFLYRSKEKGSRFKRRYLFVLGYKFTPENMKKSSKKVQMISGVDLSSFSGKPYKFIEFFRDTKISKDINITTVDSSGFRFFEIFIFLKFNTFFIIKNTTLKF